MKRILLPLLAVAGFIANSAQAHIGWDLQKCQETYGLETQSFKTGNNGETHYFRVAGLDVEVVLRNNYVRAIFYRKDLGEKFLSEEIDYLQQKNQAELIGASGYEWITSTELTSERFPVFYVQWLYRQSTPLLQSILVPGTDKERSFLEIRTWDQIAVDTEAAKQDKLQKLKGL
jgi:hypothetical protein